MAKTRAQLIERTLRDLGVAPVGQTANSEEETSVGDLIDVVVADLSARDIYYVSDPNNIEDEAFIHLARYLAWIAAPEFGLQNDAGVAALGQLAETNLKIIQSENPTYKTAEIMAW
jgi:hypothetical protein